MLDWISPLRGMAVQRSTDLATSERPLPSLPVSYEEFLVWADEDTHAEWVDGRIILMSPASLEHQDLILFLARLLAAFVEQRQLGHVWTSGLQMRLRRRPSGREPDVLFLSHSHADRLRPTFIDGPADLAIEIVSPESVERDLVEKVGEYEAHGLPEYWAVDPLQRQAHFRQLGPDGRYRLVGSDADGFYHSAVLPGFRLRVAWLWQRPLPPLADITDLTGLGPT